VERVGIRDVAAAAGVSPGTVSRALNGYRDVAQDTRRRVLAAAERLGYVPAAAGRTLATGRSGLVAACLHRCWGDPDGLQPFGRLVVAALAQDLAAHGRDLLVFETVDAAVDAMAARELEAVVLVCLADATTERLAVADALRTVAVDAPGPVQARSDHAGGLRAAVAHLQSLGHERIAYLGGPLDSVVARERRSGYLAQLDGPPLIAHADGYLEDHGERAAAQLLQERPSAIVAASDELAIGALRAATAAGLDVPRDLSLVGFDDVRAARLAPVPLTTLRQDPEAVGAAAARAVLGGPGAIVPVELVCRASTAPVATYTPPRT
jgi:LacI family transcriptional regulator